MRTFAIVVYGATAIGALVEYCSEDTCALEDSCAHVETCVVVIISFLPDD